MRSGFICFPFRFSVSLACYPHALERHAGDGSCAETTSTHRYVNGTGGLPVPICLDTSASTIAPSDTATSTYSRTRANPMQYTSNDTKLSYSQNMTRGRSTIPPCIVFVRCHLATVLVITREGAFTATLVSPYTLKMASNS